MTTNDMGKYFFTPKKLEEIIDTATIVVDTNVLLSAYQWKEASFKEVLDVLTKAAEEDRLRIPMHVLEEFMDQRPKLIQSAIERINNDIYQKLQTPKTLSSTLPLIGLLPDHDEYIQYEDEYKKSYKAYRKKLDELSLTLKGFFHKDPVLDSLKFILEKACFSNIDKKVVDIEATLRLKAKQPPLCGGDAGKKENAYGDFYIWKDILSLNDDVIFVSTDFKEDWYYLDNAKKPLSPRRELIEEFYEVNEGKSCSIASLAEYIKASAPSTSDAVISDLVESQRPITINREEIIYEIQFEAYTVIAYKMLIKDIKKVLTDGYKIPMFSHTKSFYNSQGSESFYIKFKPSEKELPSIILELELSIATKSKEYELITVRDVDYIEADNFVREM